MSPRRVYAVSWSEADGEQYVGKLELLLALLRLEGRGSASREISRTISYSQVLGVRCVRRRGHRVVLLELRDGRELEITGLDGLGALTELAHELRGRTQRPHDGSGVAPMPARA